MTVAAIGGSTRFRKNQIGVQSALLTAVATTKVLPWRGDIVVNPNLVIPDVDMGSLDPILPPFAGAKDVTSAWEGPLAYNDAVDVFAYGLKGGVTASGGGSAKTWTYQAASLTADDFDVFTDQNGDDEYVITGLGGVVNSWTLAFAEDLGAWTVSTQNVFADATLGSTFTSSIDPDENPTWVYGADTEVYVDTSAGSIGSTKWDKDTAGVHSASVDVNNNLDLKRFANGSNTRFALAGFGRGPRDITVTITTAKTTLTEAEAETIDDAPPALRYLELKATSPTIITGSTPYSLSVRVPARLQSVATGEINSNTTFVFTYKAVYDSTLTYAIRASVVNSRTSL